MQYDLTPVPDVRNRIRLWLVPAWGPGIARIECEAAGKEVKFTDSLECEYHPSGHQQHWFPSRCSSKREGSLKHLNEEEIADIQVASLNEPLSPDVFQLGSMNIPAGARVVNLRPGKVDFWDGKEAVERVVPLQAPGTGISVQVWWAVAAAVSAIIALIALWGLLPRSKPAASLLELALGGRVLLVRGRFHPFTFLLR